MPLRLRRGTDAERLTITPAEGELIYTTDLKRVYVGDGTTLGGVQITSESIFNNLEADLDLNNFDIIGTGNINIDGDISGNLIGDVTGSLFANDSTTLVDGLSGNHYGLFNGNVIGNVTGNLFGNVTGNLTGNVTGNLTGNVTGNLTGNVIGNIDGDFTGSVFADDSTIIIDGLTGNIHTNNIIADTGNMRLTSLTPGVNQIKLIAENGRSIIKLSRGSTGDLSLSPNTRYGALFFERDDINGTLTTSSITAGENFVHIIATNNGNLTDTTSTLAWVNKKLGVGTINPTEALDVQGNGSFTGSVSATAVYGNLLGTVTGDLTGSVFTDNSTLIIDGIDGHVHTNTIVSSSGNLKINSQTVGLNQVKLIAENGRSIIKLSRGSTGNLAGNTSTRYGALFFERDDINGTLTTSAITAGENFVHIIATANGNINDTTSTLAWVNKKLGVGTVNPTEALDVQGNGIFTGTLTVNSNGSFAGTVNAASFKGSVVGDDSTVIVDAINSTIAVSGNVSAGGNGLFNGTVTAASFKGSVVGDDSTVIVDAINSTIAVSGFIQFGSYSKTDRDNLGAANGMVLYNTTSNRFQGYQNGAWINLDDGTADP